MASLKVRDVAARLNVSEKTVYKWLTQGLIPATRIGRTWVITEEALEAVLSSPGTEPPSQVSPRTPAATIAESTAARSQVQSSESRDLSTLARLNALAEGAIKTGIESILLPRNSADETRNAIGEALDEAHGEVLIQGIGLREFFGDTQYTPVIRRMIDEDRSVSIRALLVHPLSDFARARAVAEIGAEFVDESSFRAGPLFGDSWRSLNVISSLRRTAAESNNANLDVRFADHWPSMYLLMTESCCFVENYHFGHPDSSPDGSSIDGLVPILKIASNAPYYRLLRNHFDYLWGGSNPYISLQTLDEVADAIRVTI